MLLSGAIVIGIVVGTAVLSSVLTLSLAHWILRRAWEERFRAVVDEAIQELGNEVEERVRRGVIEGVASIPSGEVLVRTRETLLRTAGGLVGEGLDLLAGKKRRP